MQEKSGERKDTGKSQEGSAGYFAKNWEVNAHGLVMFYLSMIYHNT
jgi:hypothetical protein